ncbi:hypothetical protein J6590_019942 [Homalodisca vitripennis]|nr:hypothetical protein J6590_066922 [Homalodisca vitripennis]KAG8337541.1 hypothetical protein J6590_019942 [Homalodisca vitripennis]
MGQHGILLYKRKKGKTVILTDYLYKNELQKTITEKEKKETEKERKKKEKDEKNWESHLYIHSDREFEETQEYLIDNLFSHVQAGTI